MKVIAQKVEQSGPPLFRLYIHNAPHRRMHRAVIQQYREKLRPAFMKLGEPLPIDYPIELSVVFVNPTSPDLDNLLMSLFQALDGKTLKKPGVLVDDRLIQVIRHLSILWN